MSDFYITFCSDSVSLNNLSLQPYAALIVESV